MHKRDRKLEAVEEGAGGSAVGRDQGSMDASKPFWKRLHDVSTDTCPHAMVIRRSGFAAHNLGAEKGATRAFGEDGGAACVHKQISFPLTI